MDTNTGMVLHGKMDMRLQSLPVPELKGNDVLLRMSSVGICGSDIKYWTHGYCGMFTLKSPMVLGHEASGTVVKLGPDVKHLHVGDRVAVEPGVSCRRCRICFAGRYNLCPAMRFCATPPVDGNICGLFAHPEDFCFKLPDHVTDDEGALMEPLAVAVHACRRGGVKSGHRVLVCGAGPVGILCMWVAKELGALAVLVTDIDDFRLDYAKSQGADQVVNVLNKSEPDVAKEVSQLLGDRPDVTIECSGSDFSMRLGIHATFPGGAVVQVGRGTPAPETPLNMAATKEVDIKGVFRYANCYPQAVQLVSSGRLPRLASLVTHHFKMADTEKAFDTARSRDAKAIKVMIHCDTEYKA